MAQVASPVLPAICQIHRVGQTSSGCRLRRSRCPGRTRTRTGLKKLVDQHLLELQLRAPVPQRLVDGEGVDDGQVQQEEEDLLVPPG